MIHKSLKNPYTVLIVTGTFNEDNGKVSYFGQKIFESFYDTFLGELTHINGGNLKDLDDCFNEISKYKIIVWMPNIDNSVDKYLSRIKAENRTAILIQSKRNDFNKYFTFQIIERMFKTHSNLCLEIKKEYNSVYNFRIIDPLGNLWYSGDIIGHCSDKLAEIAKYLHSLTRIPSIQSTDKYNPVKIDNDFLEVVRFYGWRFSSLLNIAINKERFFGNVSTRCMSGFPSAKKGDVILVSRRNVNKESMTSDSFVSVKMNKKGIIYYGDHKPSVDAPSQIMLYQYYKNVNFIIHGHTYIDNAPFTKKYVPCGYLEEAQEILDLQIYSSAYNFSINLIGHGCIILAKDLDYFAKLGMSCRKFPEDLSHLYMEV